MSGDRVEQLIALGREHYNANEYERAEPFLAEAASARPGFPDLYNMLGVIYHAQGRFSDAEEAFESALRAQPALHRGRAEPVGHLQRSRQVRARARGLHQGRLGLASGSPTRSIRSRAASSPTCTPTSAPPTRASRCSTRRSASTPSRSTSAPTSPTSASASATSTATWACSTPRSPSSSTPRSCAPTSCRRASTSASTMFSLGRQRCRDRRVARGPADRSDNKSAPLYIRMCNDENGPQPGSALPR